MSSIVEMQALRPSDDENCCFVNERESLSPGLHSKMNHVNEDKGEVVVETIGAKTRRMLRGPLLGPINNFLTGTEKRIVEMYRSQRTCMKASAGILFVIAYLIYFGFALSIDAGRAVNLIYLTVFGLFCFFYWLVKKFFGTQISECCCQPVAAFLIPRKKYFKW